MTPSEIHDADLLVTDDEAIAVGDSDRSWIIPEDPLSSPSEEGPRPRHAQSRRAEEPRSGQASGGGRALVSGSGPTRRDDALSRILGSIYDAALDAALWPQVLATTADHVGGQSALLQSKDIATSRCTVHHQSGFASGDLELYRDDYWRMDPFAVSVFFPNEQPTTVKDYMPHDEFRDGRFYREWGRPQGWIDAVSVVLDRSPTTCSTFLVATHETRGIVDDEMSARMELIAPHIRRAVQIGRLVDVGQAEAATFSDVFDGLSAGVFLVDGGGRIVHANLAGRALLTDGDPFFSARSRLTARDASTERTLRAALATIAGGDPEGGDGAIALPVFSEDGERHVAHVLPLTAGAGPRAGIARTAVAALFVHKAEMDRPTLPETVARHYKLTPTELRVLLGIVEVGGAPEVADALGITDNTVKTHLGRVYQKTGTRRQVDLVKLVAGFATPLLG